MDAKHEKSVENNQAFFAVYIRKFLPIMQLEVLEINWKKNIGSYQRLSMFKTNIIDVKNLAHDSLFVKKICIVVLK